MRRRGARAAVGASLRLRRSRSAARAREASGRAELGRRLVSSIAGRPQSAVDSMSWRSRKNRDITQLELELEAGDVDAGLVSSGAHKALEDYAHVDLGGPMAAALAVPKDGLGCDLIRLTFPSGAAVEFNAMLRPGEFLFLETPLSPEDVTEVRN